MKLEKILDNLNSLEKNSFIKIIDNIIANGAQNSKEIENIKWQFMQNTEANSFVEIAFDEEKNYSESGIINRNSGELVHEVTKDIKSDNFEKDISFYKCS